MAEPLLELRNLAKSFGATRAIQPVDLAIHAGEIIGLVGENGAGKSTLIKLLSGVHRPDQGTIRLSGKSVTFPSPRAALAAGIATLQQELEYFAHLSVAENMLLGESWPRHPWGSVDWTGVHALAGRRLTEFGLSLDTQRTLEELTAAEKQEVAIAGALAKRARVLILDEPTASLTEPEVKRLFSHLRRLREQGVAVLYVSHRLDEIFELTDRIIVLREGALVAAHRTAAVDSRQLVQDMIGRPLETVYPRTRFGQPGEPLLELCDVSRTGMFHNVSLTLRAGEILGLTGLVGSGRSELARGIYGLYAVDCGTMQLCGKAWQPRRASQSLASRLVYIPEERKRQGLVPAQSLSETISIGFSDRLTKLGMISRRAEQTLVARAIERYDVRATSATQAISTLSGGNQQKALLARWLERDPAVVILDEPTRGVDIGAKSQIHGLIDRLAAQGKGILLISSDLGEVLGMGDRILVMNRGTIETELRGGEMTEHNVILAASGLYRHSEPLGTERASS